MQSDFSDPKKASFILGDEFSATLEQGFTVPAPGLPFLTYTEQPKPLSELDATQVCISLWGGFATISSRPSASLLRGGEKGEALPTELPTPKMGNSKILYAFTSSFAILGSSACHGCIRLVFRV